MSIFLPIRKKIIGLDDLLTDHYKDKCKLVEKESKQAKKKKKYDSDDEDFGKEAVVSQVVDECQNKVNYAWRPRIISLLSLMMGECFV